MFKKIIACSFLCFLIMPTFVFAQEADPEITGTSEIMTREMGQPCPPDADNWCASNDCEESDIASGTGKLWFCDCNTDSDCEEKVGSTGYSCVDGGAGAAHNVDYCQKEHEAPLYFVTDASIALGKQEQEMRGGDTQGVVGGLAESAKKQAVQIKPPIMAVALPGLAKWEEFSATAGQTLNIPYIADYIIALYKYGLVIASILAVLALMIGGILYMIAGANSGSVGQAKKIMTGAISGLLLLLGSYLILLLLNPNLVKLSELQIDTIAGAKLPDESMIFPGGSTATGESIEALIGPYTGTPCSKEGAYATAKKLDGLNICVGPNHCAWTASRFLIYIQCIDAAKLATGGNSGNTTQLAVMLEKAGWITEKIHDYKEQDLPVGLLSSLYHVGVSLGNGKQFQSAGMPNMFVNLNKRLQQANPGAPECSRLNDETLGKQDGCNLCAKIPSQSPSTPNFRGKSHNGNQTWVLDEQLSWWYATEWKVIIHPPPAKRGNLITKVPCNTSMGNQILSEAFCTALKAAQK